MSIIHWGIIQAVQSTNTTHRTKDRVMVVGYLDLCIVVEALMLNR